MEARMKLLGFTTNTFDHYFHTHTIHSRIKQSLTIWLGTLLLVFVGSALAEPSGAQLKADLDRVLTKSYDSNGSQDSGINSIIINLKSQLSNTQDWEFEKLAPLIGNQVDQLSRLGFYPKQTPLLTGLQSQSSLSRGEPEFPDASYPDTVTWNFGIGSGDDEAPTGEAEDESEAGSCSGSVRNTPRTAFDLQMAAIISEGIARVADSVCEQVVVVLGGGNLSLACIVTEIADTVVQGVLDANLLCDDIKDSVEIEASYKRLEHIHDDLDIGVDTINSAVNTVNGLTLIIENDLSKHDSSVTSIINQHDVAIKNAVNIHDTDIKSDITLHDTDINTNVTLHDTEIKVFLTNIQADLQEKLGVLQSTANTNGAMLLEVIRLLHTPNGRRTSDIAACDSGPCEWSKK
jgi:hypothetical protein